jgi:hypothetical protein
MARTIKTSGGTELELDGDVLAVLETISRDLTRKSGLDYGFEEVDQDLQQLIGQMTPEELKAYLKESLFMSFNRFENERLAAMVKKAGRAKEAE